MGEVSYLFRNVSFGPDDIRTLCEAFELAISALHDRGRPSIVDEVIAARIIQVAQAGERDPKVLAENALKLMGLPLRD